MLTNVLNRLTWVYKERYGIEPTLDTIAKMAMDYDLAKRQGFTYLTEHVENVILMWNKPNGEI